MKKVLTCLAAAVVLLCVLVSCAGETAVIRVPNNNPADLAKIPDFAPAPSPSVPDGSGETDKTDKTYTADVPVVPADADAETENVLPPSPVPEKKTKVFYAPDPDAEYTEGVLLVKYEETDDVLELSDFADTPVVSFAPLYVGSLWYKVCLSDGTDTVASAKALADLGIFKAIDYDYVMTGDADVHSVDISGNTESVDISYLDAMGIRDAWDYFVVNEKHPGGSPDVIVAVIDTGVDYNHIDLRNNIWRNPGEIPDNGVDDDGNGYIDDVYGWNCVGDNNNPMDDNGHGTHVAGIIAADNNAFGVVGVAYNCKVMCLKAGTSSGTFNNSDIAEAIRYAYMNGASVINMSFGGASISLSVEEALEDAYNTCVLVAAAGNDGKCNQPGCDIHITQPPVPFYPASLSYVIGVMSCDGLGMSRSVFSNFDHYQYNSYEYDVYAPGEQIASTFPNNRYASLSGTSMACPNVAGIAALLRSEFTDRDKYSTKFITSQIVANGGKKIDGYYVANAYNAINNIPKPNIYGIHDYYIFDDPKFSANNNGNGIIEAGEVIHLGFELMNRGGKATDVTVSVNTKRLADDITDPYIHILSNDITYSEIGTYSIRDGGKVYDDNGKVIDVEHPIVIKIDENTPNDYLSVINFVVTYKNGLDNKDKTDYSGKGSVSLTVTNGYILPEIISEDTVFEADRRYIVAHDVTIPTGVTATFKEGCEIQYYADSQSYTDTLYDSPMIQVYGTLKLLGTNEKRINVHPSELFNCYICAVRQMAETATITYQYAFLTNPDLHGYNSSGLYNFYSALENCTVDHCSITYNAFAGGGTKSGHMLCYNKGTVDSSLEFSLLYEFDAGTISNSFLDMFDAQGTEFNALNLQNNVIIRSARVNESVTVHNTFSNNLYSFKEYGNPRSRSDRFDRINDFVIENNAYILLSQMPIACVSGFELSGDYIKGNDTVSGNIFEGDFAEIASKVFKFYFNPDGSVAISNDIEHHDGSVIWPYIKNIELFNKDGERIRIVGGEKVTAKVTFNRPMDKSVDFKLYYGSVAPYTDYVINGEYADDGMSWTGEFQVKATIEGGRNFFSAGDACAADDSFKTLINNAPAFTFDIDTTAAMSMNLQGVGTEDGIELTWVQDDYDTLMGYNVYRSDSKDGNFVRINPSVIPAGENTYLDADAEPGKLYWYTFTVVLSDFTESAPAGKVGCRSADTVNPTVYHTPVNQGYAGNNLVISCTARDNIAVDNAKLYYRTVGDSSWKVLAMSRQNDKFSVTVFGSEVTLDGLEYYIVVSDGRNEVQKGSAEAPYNVVVKDASLLSTYGDVDGDSTVTAKDALMLMQAINGDLLLSDDQFRRADLNKDGELSSVEALRILQYINGKITTLEM